LKYNIVLFSLHSPPMRVSTAYRHIWHISL